MDPRLNIILEHYGLDKQLDQTVEECAELIVAINKWKRAVKAPDFRDIAEEIADVQIMIDQIKNGLKIEHLVGVLIDAKIARQITRIQGGA